MAMKCEFCGERIKEGALACARCGSPAGGPGHGEALSRETSRGLKAGGLGSIVDYSVAPGTVVEPQEVPVAQRPPANNGIPEGVGGPRRVEPGAGAEETHTPGGEAAADGRRTVPRAGRYVLVTLSVLVFLAILGGILYLGAGNRGGTEPESGPLGTVRSFFELAASRDYSRLTGLALPDVQLVEQVEAVLFPYHKDGLVALEGFEATSRKLDDGRVKVYIKKLTISVQPEEGEEYDKDLLEKNTKPYPVPSQVDLVRKNGRWFISG